MKRAVLLPVLMALSIMALAQVPESFNYQVVVRDGVSNNPLVNQNVSFKMSILKGSSSGESQYSELHSANTGALGIVNLVIGNGNGKTGDITTIDWGADTYYLKVEIDPAGGSAYALMGTTQLLSEPYALHAKTAESVTGTIPENDPVFITNFNLTGVVIGDLLKYDGTKFVKFTPDYLTTEVDGSVTNEIQNLSVDGNDLTISGTGGNTVALPNADGSETKLTAGTNITITGFGTTASPYMINATNSVGTHYLGEEYLGGIIFYLYTGNDAQQHGFIVSKIETPSAWQSITSTTNANRNWDGAYNMNLMTNSPAKDWITSNFSSDWYLPSIDELIILWNNQFHVNKTLNEIGATVFSLGMYYWSSTEWGPSSAITFPRYYVSGQLSGYGKTYTCIVRAIRAF